MTATLQPNRTQARVARSRKSSIGRKRLSSTLVPSRSAIRWRGIKRAIPSSDRFCVRVSSSMANAPQNDVSILVRRVGAGDQAAMPLLIEAAYRELRALAGHVFKDQPDEHTLQPTALVNELCVNLLSRDNPDWNDRKHFIRAAAAAMRNLLTDHARAKRAEKRGGSAATVVFRAEDVGTASGSSAIDIIVLDETISKLAEMDPRLGRVFELRFLANLSVRHTAELEGISERTVELDSKFIRAWLHKELQP